jgi:zinc transport system substrate-binding protein
MKRAGIIIIIALVCAGLAVPAHARKRVRVAASILPLWVFTKNVAGKRARVSLLVPPGTDIHEYSLTPRDVKSLHDADLVIISGVEVEPFLDRLPNDIKVARASTQYATPPPDPHVWLDPVMARRQVDAIAQALEDIDPQGREEYEANAQAYVKRLGELNERLENLLAPLKGMPLITYHEAFTHFAARFGLEAYSLTGPHAEQPLPRRVKQVYDVIRQRGVRAVFAEDQYPPDILKSLTADLGVQVCRISTVTTGEPYPGLYEQVMTENAETIVRCLEERDGK